MFVVVEGSDVIFYVGDVGDFLIFECLCKIVLVYVVCGNIDCGELVVFFEIEVCEFEGYLFYMFYIC